MSLILAKNSTSVLLNVFIKDSSVTTGIGKTGLGIANLNVFYYKTGESQPFEIDMVLSSVGNWISGGWVEIDAVNIPGFYQLGVPNEVLSDNSETAADNSVYIIFQDAGANNAMTTIVEIQLVSHSLDNNLCIDDLPINVNITEWNGGTVSALTVTGVPDVNVTYWYDNHVETPSIVGVPSVNMMYASGESIELAPQVDSNVTQWIGYDVSAGTDGLPEVNSVLSNVTSVDGNSDSASKFAEASNTVIQGQAITGTLTSIAMTTNLTTAVAEYYTGRVVVWTSGQLENIARTIDSYSAAGEIGYDTLPGAMTPSAGDNFIIV